MKNQCEFDPDRHEYRIDGRVVPSVTQVLGDLIPGWQASDWYKGRGQAVHACAALIANGTKFEHDPQIEGQVTALQRFFHEICLTPIAVEVQVFSARYQYAGTLDLLTVWRRERTIIDFKASLTPSVPYQLGAYALAYDEGIHAGRLPVRFGIGVEIRENGTYQLSSTYDLRRYQRRFLSLLDAYNVRRECGIATQEETVS